MCAWCAYIPTCLRAWHVDVLTWLRARSHACHAYVLACLSLLLVLCFYVLTCLTCLLYLIIWRAYVYAPFVFLFVLFALHLLTLFRIGLFGAAHRWGKGKKICLPKICHAYPAMIKLGTVIPYLKEIKINI